MRENGMTPRGKISKLVFSLLFTILSSIALADHGWASPRIPVFHDPMVIIIADKLDGVAFFRSRLPGVKSLLSQSASGLMMSRTASGYTDTGSGYFSLGSGARSTVDKKCYGAYSQKELIPGGEVQSFLEWSQPLPAVKDQSLLVPEIGMIRERGKTGKTTNVPETVGQLGTLLRNNGRCTYLIGNLDTYDHVFRPGGFLMMDQNGIMDGGKIGSDMNRKDLSFPYGNRFSRERAMSEISALLAKTPRSCIAVEFGDFYRLDYYRDEMTQARYRLWKSRVWQEFDRLISELIQLKRKQHFSLMLISPSISKEAKNQGDLMTPLVIQSPEYPTGLLSSGTTRWTGIVANDDVLPTLLHMEGIKAESRFSGRVMEARPMTGSVHRLSLLYDRLVKFNQCQRPFLNGYMTLIAFGWIGGIVCFMAHGKKWAGFLFSMVMTAPLAIILFPLLPETLWQAPFFWLFSLMVGMMLFSISSPKIRVLILAALLWGTFIIDQVSGWHLIRFSALGYNAMGGARFYGMGNELMGVFLAASLILGHLVVTNTKQRWPVWIILGCSIGILCLPQFGAKFGGILAGTFGFTCYLMGLYRLKVWDKRLWIGVCGFGLLLFVVGWWDSVRAPEVQTHIGRFIRLFWMQDFHQIADIITRKIAMNLKLTLTSPWMRINFLAAGIGLFYRLFGCPLVKDQDEWLIWRSVLLTGIAAYLVNDAGVLALATCLAFGFSYVLLRSVE